MKRDVLEEILVAARRKAPAGVVVFDLDSTLLDNRPRQARIFRDFGRLHQLPALLRATPEHWRGWDLRGPLQRLGLDAAWIEDNYPQIKAFWESCFFTSEYCQEDAPIAGAVDYVRAIAATGVHIAYLTGRHLGMRSGTVTSFERHGFPPPAARVHLLMKPTAEQDDDLWKAHAHAELAVLGPVIAAFDNEPAHINSLAKSFPNAIVVHLDTDHSGRQISLANGIPSVASFLPEQAEALRGLR
jgi:hypothetical protein